MLVLGRRPGESIMIGDDIKVKLIEENGDLRLAIDAPKHLRILRGEVYEKQRIHDYMNTGDERP